MLLDDFEFELKLNNPITPEQWGLLTDVDFDHTDRIWFHTKHDKDVTFVKERKGKWLPFEYGDESWHKCSACGKGDQFRHKVIRRYNGEVHYMESVRNYCPNCGADMRGEQDECCHTFQERF